MAYVARRLEKHLKRQAEERAADMEQKVRKELRRVVKDSLPKGLVPPKRGRGRGAKAGISKKELRTIAAKADDFLNAEGGIRQYEAEVRRNALIIMMIDGLLGMEPWRLPGHNGMLL